MDVVISVYAETARLLSDATYRAGDDDQVGAAVEMPSHKVFSFSFSRVVAGY